MSSKHEDLNYLHLVHLLCIYPRLLIQAPERNRQVSPASPSTGIDTKTMDKAKSEGLNDLPPVPDCVYLTPPQSNEPQESLLGSSLSDTRTHDSNGHQARHAPGASAKRKSDRSVSR